MEVGSIKQGPINFDVNCGKLIQNYLEKEARL